ncbi:MAG: VOC family protein [Steroidobacteraceae bacterium]
MLKPVSIASVLALCCAAWFLESAPALAQASPPAAAGKLVGISFIGRMVSNLDRSVAFYEALGFKEDPKANPAWRRDDPVVDRIYGIRHARTRMAKMYIVNAGTHERFVVYLRELEGIPRRNRSRHTAWEPGSSHFGLVVTDPDRLWSRLKTKGMLHARSWGGRLAAPPGQHRGMVAYITDPDGLDIEIIRETPAAPASAGHPGRAAFLPGVNHVGLVVLDSAKERAFYGGVLGGRLVSAHAPWLKGDFYDAAVGGHGNILRFYNESFPFAAEGRGSAPPDARINFEMVEFQNRKHPVRPGSITDIGVGYVGIEVDGLDAVLTRAQAAGAKLISSGIATMSSGTRVAMIRDPDVGGFIELYEQPAH